MNALTVYMIFFTNHIYACVCVYMKKRGREGEEEKDGELLKITNFGYVHIHN